jgi:adenine C2-methylase RlmN of 23S rRNA A2503 and tRNA A37
VTSKYEDIITFQKIVKTYGVTVTVRDTLGRDVKGACGQLGYEKIQEKQQELSYADLDPTTIKADQT